MAQPTDTYHAPWSDPEHVADTDGVWPTPYWWDGIDWEPEACEILDSVESPNPADAVERGEDGARLRVYAIRPREMAAYLDARCADEEPEGDDLEAYRRLIGMFRDAPGPVSYAIAYGDAASGTRLYMLRGVAVDGARAIYQAAIDDLDGQARYAYGEAHADEYDTVAALEAAAADARWFGR